jgi:hypothetical protein
LKLQKQTELYKFFVGLASNSGQSLDLTISLQPADKSLKSFSPRASMKQKIQESKLKSKVA